MFHRWNMEDLTPFKLAVERPIEGGMNQVPPHEVLSIAASLFAGMFMLQISLRKKAIRWKFPSRCMSCGRPRRPSGHCAHCS